MTRLITALSLVSALALSTTALAQRQHDATNSSHRGAIDEYKIQQAEMAQNRCDALIQQFDSAMPGASKAADTAKAKSLRDAGAGKCRAEDSSADGLAQVTQALKMIGVTPKS